MRSFSKNWVLFFKCVSDLPDNGKIFPLSVCKKYLESRQHGELIQLTLGLNGIPGLWIHKISKISNLFGKIRYKMIRKIAQSICPINVSQFGIISTNKETANYLPID